MRNPTKHLALHEEVALLALRNDRGTVGGGAMYAQAAGGAILAELILTGRARAVTEGRSTYAEPGDRTPSSGDAVLDECAGLIRAAKRRRKLAAWVQKFAGLRRLHHRVAAGLVAKGVLRESEGRVLLLFRRRVYPELDPSFERAIIARLESAIFREGEVDPRTTVLLAIAHHSGLLKSNFDRKRLKTRRARIQSVIKGDAIGKATQEAIAAVQAAVMAAAVLPAVIAAGSSH
jgi:Golgi phosphoprotein 3